MSINAANIPQTMWHKLSALEHELYFAWLKAVNAPHIVHRCIAVGDESAIVHNCTFWCLKACNGISKVKGMSLPKLLEDTLLVCHAVATIPNTPF